MFFGTFALILWQGESFRVKPEHRKVLAARGIGVVDFISFITGLPLVPLVVMDTILNTGAFWAALLSWFCLGESISKFEVVAMALSFIGVVLVALSNNEEEGKASGDDSSEDA